MTLNRMLRIVIAIVSVLALGSSLAGPARAVQSESIQERQATTFIEVLGEQVLAIQGLETAGAAGASRAALRHLIRGAFDLEFTSQLVLGKFWGRATAGQQAVFKDLFAQYLLDTYARHLDAYRVETLSVVDSTPVGGNDFLVRTSVERNADTVIAVWRVRARAGDYRIIDVLIDGISLALTQRSEFASVIGRNGLEGMLAVLRERVSGQAKAAGENLRVALPASVLLSPSAGKINLLLRLQ